MAIYHCNISNVSRGKGSSACATLAYISALTVRDERLDKTFKYGREERVVAVGTIIPDYAPKAYQKPSVLFNALEKFETSSNARIAKKIEVALPRELNLKEQQQIVEKFINKNFKDKGFASTYAIHFDKDNNNPHAHILVANRAINEKGEWCRKCRKEYANAIRKNGDCYYNPNVPTDTKHRIPLIDEKTGEQKVDSRNRKQWKRVNVEVNPLDRKETLQELREDWAKACNEFLTEQNQIDHRSYVEQGIDKVPTIHEGYGARMKEQRGEKSERCEINRQIRAEESRIDEDLKENRAFISVLNENDKRLQDLKNVAYGQYGEISYNNAYGSIVTHLSQGVVPVLYCREEHDSQEIITAVHFCQKPSEAEKELNDTKAEWKDYIKERTAQKRKYERENRRKGKDRVEQGGKAENPIQSLTERFKGWFEAKAKEKEQKKALEEQKQREYRQKLARIEAKKKAIVEKMNEYVESDDYDRRLEQLDFVVNVYKKNRDVGYSDLREQAFKRLGELTDLPMREYDRQIDYSIKRDSQYVPLQEVDVYVQRAREKLIREKNTTFRVSLAELELRFKREKEMQKERQRSEPMKEPTNKKSRDMER